MKDIKDLLGKYCHSYRGFYLIPRTSKFGVMEIRFIIHTDTFRRLYDGKFKTIYEAEKFIDRNYQLLNQVSTADPIFQDKYNSEYFTGGYNYYGELIDKYGS